MKISFFGAAREVTGSCHLVEALDSSGKPHRFLVDCGMFQGEERLCGSKNLTPFSGGAGSGFAGGFDPKSVEAVFVSHPHADHTGRLPKLLKEGFAGRVVMTRPCCALTRIVLEDAAHIMEENARRCDDPVLYSEDDLTELISRCEGVGYHEQVELAPGITVMFHDAGHVLGSSFVSIEAEGKRLVFSGDIGNDDVPILPPTERLSRADAVVCESTYGHRVHEPMAMREAKLREAIEQVIRDKGVLMIPSFSIERTQELLYAINNLLKELKTDMPMFLDSPMAIRATEIYRQFKEYLLFDRSILSEPDRDFFSFPNLRETLTVPESKAIFDVEPPYVLIAGSGMMSGGRILHHLIRHLPDPNSTLLIIGYQAAGTLGRKIYEGAKHVKVFREEVKVRCQVKAIGSFSAHGDMNKLTRWLRPEEGGVPKKIFLVHGDPEAQDVFETHLRHELRTEVHAPSFGETVEV